MRKNIMTFALLAMTAVLVLSACGPAATTVAPATQVPPTQPANTQVPPTEPAPTATTEPFVFGMLLVGPRMIRAGARRTYDGGLYVEQKIPGSKMLYLENVYSGSPSYPGSDRLHNWPNNWSPRVPS